MKCRTKRKILVIGVLFPDIFIKYKLQDSDKVYTQYLKLDIFEIVAMILALTFVIILLIKVL